MSDEVRKGRPPRGAEAYWGDAAADLTPQKALERVDATVGFVFGNVTVVVALVAGLGLATGASARLSAHQTQVRVILGLLAAALLLALLAAVPTVTKELHTGRADVVERYYTRRIRIRGRLVAAAMLAFTAAFALGLVVTFQSLDDRPSPALSLQWRTGSPSAVVVATVRAQLPAGLVAETRLTQLSGDREGAALVVDRSEVDATGKLDVTATATPPAGAEGFRLRTTVYDGTAVWSEAVHVDLVAP